MKPLAELTFFVSLLAGIGLITAGLWHRNTTLVLAGAIAWFVTALVQRTEDRG